MESSEYATDRGTTWRSTARALPENVQQVMHRATSTAEDVLVLTKAGRRRLAEQQHWLPLGVCPDCQGGSLTAEHACDRCGLDWTKELKDMDTDHLRVGNRVHVVAPPAGVAVFNHPVFGKSFSVLEAPAFVLSYDELTNLYHVELGEPPGFESRLPADWLMPARPESGTLRLGVPDTTQAVIETLVAAKGQRVFTKADLLALHDTICREAKDIMVLKNQDYSGSTDDPFGNFRASSVVGVDPVAGIVLRCLDKFCRLRSFITSGQLCVKDEPVGDIFRDVVNYMILAAGMVEEARRLKKQDDCTVSLSEFP